MFTKLRRLFSKFSSKTNTINNQPLNKISLIVIILVDIFILINVFTGLDHISQWYLSPNLVYPCYSDWKNYRDSKVTDRDYQNIVSSINRSPYQLTWYKEYQLVEQEHLGQVSPICLDYAKQLDLINNPANKTIINTINQQESEISSLKDANAQIKKEYDSTLLEKIAQQKRSQSINTVSAEKAKQQLEKNNQDITNLNQQKNKLKAELINKEESSKFLSLLKTDNTFKEVESKYQQANFWYPTIQLVFQTLFLLPLIIIALVIHSFAQRKSYGLVALITWHLLVIFSIPLIIKVFEFLQFGVIFSWLFTIVTYLFGRLLFLINLFYILIIPVLGFGLIKFFQKAVFNNKVQFAQRVQLSQCMNCGKKINIHDAYCPHCSYYQYLECPNCHNLTYKNLPYCRSCGHPQIES
jgi:hypothetical protein